MTAVSAFLGLLGLASWTLARIIWPGLRLIQEPSRFIWWLQSLAITAVYVAVRRPSSAGACAELASRAAVAGVLAEGRNLRLALTNGVTAPVARSSVTAVRQAGWLERADQRVR